MDALQFEAVKVSLKQDRTGFILTLNIHPDEIPEELMRDFVGARYGVAMVRIQDDETATPYENRVKKAGILCRTREFQFWLFEEHGATSKTEEAATETVHKICGSFCFLKIIYSNAPTLTATFIHVGQVLIKCFVYLEW